MTASAPPRTVPLPRIWGTRSRDIGALLVGNGVLILAMWIRHGGLEQLSTPSDVLSGAGQIAALFGTYLALIQLVLMSRSPWLDEAFGMDRLAWWHRWLGFGTVWLIGGHLVLTLAGWALGDERSLADELLVLLGTYPYVLWGLIGFVVFVAIGLISLRAVRHRLPYELWFWLHMGTYVAIALAFLHQLFTGSDFVHDEMATLYWIVLYDIAIALILVFRLGLPIVASRRHQLRVAAVVPEGPGVVSIYLTGRELDTLAVRSGQYFVFRFMTRQWWWRGHPFSISSAPNGSWLRITVKARGDDTHKLQTIPVGTGVFIEGPYGVMTGARRTKRKVTLIAGGVGIAPLRALLESTAAAPGELVLLYRAGRKEDLVFKDELDLLAKQRKAVVRYLVGHRKRMQHDPLGPASIGRLVPDIAEHDVYVCGPNGMMDTVDHSLWTLGVPRSQIHAERFSY